MSASNYLENKILDHVLGSSALAQPSALYVALSTGSFNDDNSGTELSGNGYSRKVITFGTASSGSISNNSAVEFDTATGDQGTISHFGIFDASSGGNLLYHGAFSSSKVISTGDVLKISSSSLTVSLD
nr:b-glycanase [uncultured Mediterranean phage uvMED]|tara:strand:+ start:1133 stop:1516 length:384 start_codon:yes stop_codon:yes gene_type:complete